MRILLADHHKQSLWALRTMLQAEAEFDLVGEAVDLTQLLELVEKYIPDLILVDRRLPKTDMADLIPTLHALKPRPIVVVMSNRSEDSGMALRAGADAFVSKSDQPEWLMITLRKYARQVRTSRGIV